MVQLPLTQADDALGTAHTRPHPPHAVMLVCVSMHAPAQHVCPVGHALDALQPITQRLPTQSVPELQCSSVTHSTQARMVTSQWRAAVPPSTLVPQASSLRQPGTHVWLASAQ